MDMSRAGSAWVRVSAALLLATPLILLGNQPVPLIAPAVVEVADTPQTPTEVEKPIRCGSVEWPSPRTCATNESKVRVITPTTTKVPTEALRAAEAQVAAEIELMKIATSKASRDKPLPPIRTAKSKKLISQKYAMRVRLERHQVDTALLGHGY